MIEFIHRNNLDDISSRWTRIARFAPKQFIDDDEHLLGSRKFIGIPRTDFRQTFRDFFFVAQLMIARFAVVIF